MGGIAARVSVETSGGGGGMLSVRFTDQTGPDRTGPESLTYALPLSSNEEKSLRECGSTSLQDVLRITSKKYIFKFGDIKFARYKLINILKILIIIDNTH